MVASAPLLFSRESGIIRSSVYSSQHKGRKYKGQTQQFLNFVRSLSTVSAFAYCLCLKLKQLFFTIIQGCGNEMEVSRNGDEYLTAMANCIATVFASMLEFPSVRYRAAKSLDPTTMTTFCDLIPTKLVATVWNCLMKYKTLPNFLQIETCELFILDRSIDHVAPIIHEWMYDAIIHDLLEMDGNKYVHEVPSKTGGFEKKEALLEEHDPVWLELRHSHIADASERFYNKMTNFVLKNKVAQMHQGASHGRQRVWNKKKPEEKEEL